MDWADKVNGLFELLGGWFVLLSVMDLRRVKRVSGISWIHMAFFTAWGWWNLVYYAQLGQWLSWSGGIVLVLTNSAYLAQLCYYTRFPGGRVAAPDQVTP